MLSFPMSRSTKPLHSSALQASPASSSAPSVNGARPGPVGALGKARAFIRTAPPATLFPFPTCHFRSSTVDSPFLAVVARLLRSRQKTSRRVIPLFATLTTSLQLTENTATLSPFRATLADCVKHKSFVCHSYRKHRGVHTLSRNPIPSIFMSSAPARRSFILFTLSPEGSEGSLGTNPFKIRTYEKRARNSFRIRTSKTRDLKSFRIRTYEKTRGGAPSFKPSSCQIAFPLWPNPGGPSEA